MPRGNLFRWIVFFEIHTFSFNLMLFSAGLNGIMSHQQAPHILPLCSSQWKLLLENGSEYYHPLSLHPSARRDSVSMGAHVDLSLCPVEPRLSSVTVLCTSQDVCVNKVRLSLPFPLYITAKILQSQDMFTLLHIRFKTTFAFHTFQQLKMDTFWKKKVTFLCKRTKTDF